MCNTFNEILTWCFSLGEFVLQHFECFRCNILIRRFAVTDRHARSVLLHGGSCWWIDDTTVMGTYNIFNLMSVYFITSPSKTEVKSFIDIVVDVHLNSCYSETLWVYMECSYHRINKIKLAFYCKTDKLSLAFLNILF